MSEIVMITSGKGGVGKTSITALLGLQISQTDKKVVLIDTDFGFRNLDLFFHLENRILYNIADVLRHMCSIKQALLPIQDNLYLIPGTKETSCSFSLEAIRQLIYELTKEFDYIIFDTSAGFTNMHRLLLQVCNTAVLVVTMDSFSLSDCMQMRQLLQKDDVSMKCIVNQPNRAVAGWRSKRDIPYYCGHFLHASYLGCIPWNRQLNDLHMRKIERTLQDICNKL